MCPVNSEDGNELGVSAIKNSEDGNELVLNESQQLRLLE
jgi:hypothetical protein